MVKLLIAIAELIAGIIIFPLFSLIGIIYTFFKHTYQLNYSISKQLIPLIRSVTLSLDGLACASGGELLNDVYKLQESKIKYGKWYNTISGVTGLLLIFLKKETGLRITLDKILGKNHCIDAIREEENYYYKNLLKNA